MDVLGKLFGTTVRVKLMRLFLFNPKDSFSLAEAAERTRCLTTVVRREVVLFERIGLLRHRKSGRGKDRALRYHLSPDFTHTEALQQLLLNTPVQPKEVMRRLRKVGSLKLIVISGLFMGDFDGRIDLLIVGDRVHPGRLSNAAKILETELGKEIRYAVLRTADFKYRIGLHDKLMRDIIDYPHRIVLDRLHIAFS